MREEKRDGACITENVVFQSRRDATLGGESGSVTCVDGVMRVITPDTGLLNNPVSGVTNPITHRNTSASSAETTSSWSLSLATSRGDLPSRLRSVTEAPLSTSILHTSARPYPAA